MSQTLDKIIYHKKKLPNGPTFELSKKAIYKIRFSNGYIEVFDENYLEIFEANNISDSSLTNLFTIGYPHQGGIIFHLDSTGQHGLIATSAFPATKWSTVYVVTDAVYLDDGKLNTKIIVEYMIQKMYDGKNEKKQLHLSVTIYLEMVTLTGTYPRSKN